MNKADLVHAIAEGAEVRKSDAEAMLKVFTDVVMKMVEQLGTTYGIPVLGVIRTDQAVGKAGRIHKMIADVEPGSKALEDYEATATALLELFGVETPQKEHVAANAV